MPRSGIQDYPRSRSPLAGGAGRPQNSRKSAPARQVSGRAFRQVLSAFDLYGADRIAPLYPRSRSPLAGGAGRHLPLFAGRCKTAALSALRRSPSPAGRGLSGEGARDGGVLPPVRFSSKSGSRPAHIIPAMSARSAGMEVRTHLGIDRRLVGEPLAVGEGWARTALATLPEMAADASGLVHGGFVFGLADYAAMLAVNHPHVVLAGAEVRFLKPVAAGERRLAGARLAESGGLAESAGRRRRVEVEVRRAGANAEAVFSGTFHCAVPDRHVLAPLPDAAAAPAGSGA